MSLSFENVWSGVSTTTTTMHFIIYSLNPEVMKLLKSRFIKCAHKYVRNNTYSYSNYTYLYFYIMWFLCLHAHRFFVHMHNVLVLCTGTIFTLFPRVLHNTVSCWHSCHHHAFQSFQTSEKYSERSKVYVNLQLVCTHPFMHMSYFLYSIFNYVFLRNIFFKKGKNCFSIFHILKRCIKKYQYLYIFNIASEFSRHCFLYAHDGFMDKFKKLCTDITLLSQKWD